MQTTDLTRSRKNLTLRTWNKRVLFYTALLFGLLLINFYAARLASHVSVRKPIDFINSIEDLEKKNLELYIRQGTATLDSFRYAGEGNPRKRIWHNQLSKSPKFVPETLEETWKSLLEQPNSIILINHNRFLDWLDRQPSLSICDFHIAIIEAVELGFGFNKDFPFLDAMNYQLFQMKEQGLLAKLKTNWTSGSERIEEPVREEFCFRSGNNAWQGVSFGSVAGLFTMLLSASIVAFVLVVFEFFKVCPPAVSHQANIQVTVHK